MSGSGTGNTAGANKAANSRFLFALGWDTSADAHGAKGVQIGNIGLLGCILREIG
ncbi:MAG: hypothetical protein KF726_26990 [Anaerolineae bacterium]|nr:hypothetical protein [Anaerolineae bacterium]